MYYKAHKVTTKYTKVDVKFMLDKSTQLYVDINRLFSFKKTHSFVFFCPWAANLVNFVVFNLVISVVNSNA